MLSKMPWLVSRRRLLILGIADYSIILILFFILQTNNFINTNFLAINLLALCWILVSYTLDKYSISEDDFNIYIYKKLLRVINTSILSGVVFKFIIIFISILNSNVGDGKWIIFIIFIAFFSYLYEILHAFIIKKYLAKDMEWISIYSNIKKGSLILEPIYIKNNFYNQSIHKSKISELTKSVKNPYIIKSLIYQLFDVMLWFKSYKDENPDIESNKNKWENKSFCVDLDTIKGTIQQDSEGNYYHEKYLFPYNQIHNIYEIGREVEIIAFVVNTNPIKKENYPYFITSFKPI